MSMGGDGETGYGSTAATVAEALELARDSPEGARDPTVVSILDAAITEIWSKIQQKPTSYVMTRDEFAVFNYFQDRFHGNEIAVSAKGRYWDSQGQGIGAATNGGGGS